MRSSTKGSRKRSSGTGEALSARTYICVCGFVPPSLAAQKRHRRGCLEWKDRADPRGLMLTRRKAALQTPLEISLCDVCGWRRDRHAPSCPQSASEAARRESIERAGLSPEQFDMLIVALRLMYPRRARKS